MSASSAVIACVRDQLGFAQLTATPPLQSVEAGEPLSFVPAALHVGANAIGRAILTARDQPELVILLDEALENPLLRSVQKLCAPQISPEPQDLPTGERPGSQLALLRRSMSPEQFARLLAIDPLVLELAKLLLRAATRFPASPRLDSTAEEMPVIEQFYNPNLPPAAGLLLLATARGEVAMLALLAAGMKQLTIAPWLEAGLVDRVVDGARSRLRALASVPELNADPAIVPFDQRLDLAALTHQTQQAHKGAALVTLMAAASGQDTYRPWPEVAEEP